MRAGRRKDKRSTLRDIFGGFDSIKAQTFVTASWPQNLATWAAGTGRRTGNREGRTGANRA